MHFFMVMQTRELELELLSPQHYHEMHGIAFINAKVGFFSAVAWIYGSLWERSLYRKSLAFIAQACVFTMGIIAMSHVICRALNTGMNPDRPHSYVMLLWWPPKPPRFDPRWSTVWRDIKGLPSMFKRKKCWIPPTHSSLPLSSSSSRLLCE